MKVATLNNSIDTEIRQVITWQYDNAPNLIQLVYLIRSMYTQSTAALWNQFAVKTHITDGTKVDGFGLALWGKLLNCPRPILSYGSPATDHVLSAENYRKLLIGRFRLLNGRPNAASSATHIIPAQASLDDYLAYVKFVYGNYVKVEEKQAQNGVMSLTFTVSNSLSDELKALCSQYPSVAFALPAGVDNNNPWTGNIFGLDGQQNGTASDPTIGNLDNSCFYWRKKIPNPKGSGEVWTD